MELHERLRIARESVGLTQDEMAEIIGLSQTAVSQIEQGTRKKANVKYIDELIVNHNIKYAWLMHEKGNMINNEIDKSKVNEKTFEKTNTLEYFENNEATEILEKILEQQKENNKQLDKMLNSLTSAYATIEKLTNRLLNTESNLGKHKAYTTQQVGPSSTSVYAYS